MATSKESYRDNPLLKRVGVKVEYTKEQFDEYVKCAQDPIYFTKYMNIITLDEGLVPFNMYDFQKDMISTFHDNRFSIVKCPRQVGKTTTAVAYCGGGGSRCGHSVVQLLQAHEDEPRRDEAGDEGERGLAGAEKPPQAAPTSNCFVSHDVCYGKSRRGTGQSRSLLGCVKVRL